MSMNERISTWSIVSNNLHRWLMVVSVPMVILILWQLYASDKVIEVMRSNDLSVAALLYFTMVGIEVGVLAFVLRVGRSEVARRVTGLCVLALPFIWILFNSMYYSHGIGVFGLYFIGVPAFVSSLLYSLVILGLIYNTFILPYRINSGVSIKVDRAEDDSNIPNTKVKSKKVVKAKSGKKTLNASTKSSTEKKISPKGKKS